MRKAYNGNGSRTGIYNPKETRYAEKIEANKLRHLLHRKSKLDLVNLQTASGLLKKSVADDGKVLYVEEEGYFEALCPYLYKCYYETHKFRQVKRAIFEKKLAEELKNARS